MKHDRISIDPKVMAGKPVISGTRIPVEKILRELGNGLSYDDILREYPRLTHSDILAAQALCGRLHAGLDRSIRSCRGAARRGFWLTNVVVAA